MTDDLAATRERLHEAERESRERGELIRELLLAKYEPIAIVGVGLRLPGGNDSLDEFADFLHAGRSAITPIPRDRWDVDGFASGVGRGTVRTAAGGFLDDIAAFDPRFFNISAKEARCMDPQQRLALETAWAALEDATIDPTRLRHGDGAVYFGASSMDYLMEADELGYPDLEGHIAAGVAHAGVSGRLSYFLGWRGPSVTVDTACSSALVALHTAVGGLRAGECDIALCGGVNAVHHPRSTVLFSDLGALAPDGRCKTFDETADGYGRAEGCGVLVLKRLTDARRDGDRILALVRGSAVRQDGESAALTAPNGTAQEAVMRAALASARLRPDQIQYVEAHGTGTPLGDPIEMGAISDVFADSHDTAKPIVVGSVKTNVGHLEPAAGVVGIAKAVAQLRAGVYFAHLNLATPSSRIPWHAYPVTVPTANRPWAAEPRRALVNAFGFTGTIATAVLEQAPAQPDPPAPAVAGPHVFALSAKTSGSLRNLVQRYRKQSAQQPDLPVVDVCRTATVGRAHFAYRVAGVVADGVELADFLAAQQERLADPPQGGAGGIRKVAFLFTGQGAQYAGMGAAAYRRFPVFRQRLDECDELFRPHIGESIRDLLTGDVPDPTVIDDTRYTQPALFALEYALAKLWLSWGVRPSALLGHSIGEWAAAAVAGLFDLPTAVRLVAARARLMASVGEPGGMLSVRAAEADVAPLVAEHPRLAIAAVNAPTQCVVSGAADELALLAARLRRDGIAETRLAVSQAFHSPLMASAAEQFRAEFDGVRCHEPELTIISDVTGQVARWRQVSTPDYWVRHLLEPVRFEAGVRTIAKRGQHAFVEIGPDATLVSLARKSVPAADHLWLPSLRRADRSDAPLLTAVARYYAAGLPFSWPDFHAGQPGQRITLPGYAFERERYWLPNRQLTDGARHPTPATPPVVSTAVSDKPRRTLAPDVLASATDDERPALIGGYLLAAIADLLNLDTAEQVGMDTDFVELGLDSLSAVGLRGMLESALDTSLPVAMVFDHPTVRRLSAFLARRSAPRPTDEGGQA